MDIVSVIRFYSCFYDMDIVSVIRFYSCFYGRDIVSVIRFYSCFYDRDIVSVIMFYSCFYDMNIEYTTHTSYSFHLNPNCSLTITSNFDCLPSDDKNNQLLVRHKSYMPNSNSYFSPCAYSLTVISAMHSILRK
jgi:hypothetical protein